MKMWTQTTLLPLLHIMLSSRVILTSEKEFPKRVVRFVLKWLVVSFQYSWVPPRNTREKMATRLWRQSWRQPWLVWRQPMQPTLLPLRPSWWSKSRYPWVYIYLPCVLVFTLWRWFCELNHSFCVFQSRILLWHFVSAGTASMTPWAILCHQPLHYLLY